MGAPAVLFTEDVSNGRESSRPGSGHQRAITVAGQRRDLTGLRWHLRRAEEATSRPGRIAARGRSRARARATCGRCRRPLSAGNSRRRRPATEIARRRGAGRARPTRSGRPRCRILRQHAGFSGRERDVEGEDVGLGPLDHLPRHRPAQVQTPRPAPPPAVGPTRHRASDRLEMQRAARRRSAARRARARPAPAPARPRSPPAIPPARGPARRRPARGRASPGR